MKFEAGIMAVMAFLVLAVLAMIVLSGDFEENPGAIICTLEYAPVCGIDGKTYSNHCMLESASVALDHDGECMEMQEEIENEVEEIKIELGEDIALDVSDSGEESIKEEIVEESMVEEEPTMEVIEEEIGPQTHVVSLPEGSGVPGCEETNECYIPFSLEINAGDTVTWNNDDTAAHTVTSGIPAEGPDGNFDSSLFMAGNTFEITFDEAGEYPYFCMVHPWMVGTIQVN